MKKTSLGLLLTILLTGGGIFTSCENFLKAEELKNQIEAQIAYANAVAYTVTVNYNSEEGQLRKPAWGEISVKETDTFDLKFEPAKNHSFARWEATSADLPAGESIDDYIFIENPNSPETKATFKKALTSVVIKAVCPHLPFTEISITGSKGKFAPVKGTYVCVDTNTYPLSFDPDGDYEFIRWELFDNSTNAIIQNGTYIRIDDIYEADTTYSFVAAPDNPEISIAVRPILAERPQVLSSIPLYGIDNNLDSSIQVIFDHDMDEYSIYYTNDEVTELMNSGIDRTNFLTFTINNELKYYGYKVAYGPPKAQKYRYYYKNITITDENGENLCSKFNMPIFENPRKLSISPNQESPLVPWTQICVTLDKSFFYEKEGKVVTMPLSKKWLYMVTEGTDEEAPSIVGNITVKTEGVQLNPSNSDITNASSLSDNKKKIYIEATIQDTGSGPAEDFIIELTQYKKYKNDGVSLENSSVVKTKNVSYQNVSSQRGTFKGEVSLFDLDLTNGFYKMRLIFKDRQDNSRDVSYYYFKINYKSATPIPTVLWCVSRGTNSATVAWLPPVYNSVVSESPDYDKYGISWEGRSKNGETYSGSAEFNKNNYAYTINNVNVNGSLIVYLWTKTNNGAEGSPGYFDLYATPSPEITFFMPVEDTFTITNEGIVATGQISRGIIYPDNSIQIVGLGNTTSNSVINTTITKIEMFRKEMPFAAAGDNVGLLFGPEITDKKQIKRGMLVCKPGEIAPHKKFKAYIYLYSTEEGGRSTGVTSGYRPQFYLQSTDITGAMTFEKTILNPGDDCIAVVELISYAGLFPGEEFKIREGGYTRGYGTILEILE